ncbi:hypothetical protein JW926_18965 [Candidatus Sumerlaeota bacterium]|nr:hypothetical protein [Candidatus Sumerlaeota bacterium]
MKKIFVILLACSFLMNAAILKAQNPLAPVSHESKLIPLSSYSNFVPDPKAREILVQIERRLSAINSASCEVTKTNIAEKGVLEERVEMCFQRPDLYFAKSTNVKHPLAFMQNSMTYFVMDGKYLWQYIQNAPGSGKAMFEGKNVPQAQMEAFIKKHETPRILRFDITRLRDAGKTEVELVMKTDQFINPFFLCDPLSLKLEREDEKTWIFLGKASSKKPFQNLDFMRLYIGRENGMMQKLGY